MNSINLTPYSGANPDPTCQHGSECTETNDSHYPCLCVCQAGACTFQAYSDVEKMNTIITPKNVGVVHTNFPVSSTAINNFKNPLGKVAFANTNPIQSLGEIVPDYWTTELKDEPLKIGWQQPIVGWSETPTSRLNLTDTFINALVRGKHHP